MLSITLHVAADAVYIQWEIKIKAFGAISQNIGGIHNTVEGTITQHK